MERDSDPHELFYFFSDTAAIWIMCFTGGFMDAAGFVKLQRLFIVSVTGNLVVGLASIYRPYNDVLPRVLIVLCFAAGIMSSTMIIIYMKIVRDFTSRVSAIALNTLKVLIFIAAMTLGLIYDEKISNSTNVLDWAVITVALMLTFAMGIHVATVKECMPYSPQTAVMTTNVLTLSINFCAWLYYLLVKNSMLTFGKDKNQHHLNAITEKFRIASKKLITSCWPLLYFIIGAAVGSISAIELSFWALLIPIFAVIMLTVDIYIGYRKKGGGVTRPWFDPDPLNIYYTDEEEARHAQNALDPELNNDEKRIHGADRMTRSMSEVEIAAM